MHRGEAQRSVFSWLYFLLILKVGVLFPFTVSRNLVWLLWIFKCDREYLGKSIRQFALGCISPDPIDYYLFSFIRWTQTCAWFTMKGTVDSFSLGKIQQLPSRQKFLRKSCPQKGTLKIILFQSSHDGQGCDLLDHVLQSPIQFGLEQFPGTGHP